MQYIDNSGERFAVETLDPHSGQGQAACLTSAAGVGAGVGVALAEVIVKVHGVNYWVDGARKMHAELHRSGHRVARCIVERLSEIEGLRGISRSKGPRTTVPGAGPDTRPDLVDRQFTAAAPRQLWVADITHCRTFTGWAYTAFVIDVFSRRVGWQLSRSLRTDLAVDVLDGSVGPPEPATAPTASCITRT